MNLTNPINNIIPVPVSVTISEDKFTLSSKMNIYVDPGNPEVISIGRYLAAVLASGTGVKLGVYESAVEPQKETIYLTTVGGDPSLGEEGYELAVTPDKIILRAPYPAGLFWGVQTIHQLVPASIEASSSQPGPWEIPAAEIRDYPRFAWRGTMLDVSRHFFGVEDVERYIDLMAYYKLNTLHMHLSDDQGWRLMIDSWPNLALHGGSTQVGGGPGGYYTQAEYADIVAYARSHYITVIPEIDTPSHINAALASYAELNCDGEAPPLYTGTKVGFSSLCIDSEITYTFLDDVIGELAALTPGPFIHIGGDEAHATSEVDYLKFMARIQEIVTKHGKQVIGWDEITKSDLLPTTAVQFWRPGQERLNLKPGVKVVMSPAARVYLDMKYDSSTPLGLDWAGMISVKDSYTWDPAAQLEDVAEDDILGVEAPLWTETIETFNDVAYMVFPRLLGVAEIGWSTQAKREWDAYRDRLATHGPRLAAMGVNYYPSPLVPWP